MEERFILSHGIKGFALYFVPEARQKHYVGWSMQLRRLIHLMVARRQRGRAQACPQ
jgi:hypothetical protein